MWFINGLRIMENVMDMTFNQGTCFIHAVEDKKISLVKVICMAISKTLFYHCKDPEKSRVLLLGTTGISAVNIGGTTIHSGLGIKLGTKLLGLNEKSKAALRNRLSEVKLLIID